MTKTASAVLALAFIASPAFAADFGGAKSACANAIAAEAGRTLQGATAKLLKARSGATQQVTVKVSYADGATATGKCRILRGEVQSVELDA